MDETHLSVFHSISNRARERRSRNSISSRYAFNSFFFFFFSNKRLYDIHVTRFYIESVTAHRIKINDHSCFHNSWPIQIKTKIKTSLRAGGPWCFGGPMQPAYSVYREDRLCLY